MKIDIQSCGLSLTNSLLKYSEQRLLLAMSYFSHNIRRVVIKLSDINNLRGGTEKHCRLQVIILGLPDIVVEDTEADMYAAIDRAMDRARRTVARKLNRQQTLLKNSNHYIEAPLRSL